MPRMTRLTIQDAFDLAVLERLTEGGKYFTTRDLMEKIHMSRNGAISAIRRWLDRGWILPYAYVPQGNGRHSVRAFVKNPNANLHA